MNQELHDVIGAEAPKLSPLQILRHSTAHVMTTAVKRLYPEAKLTIGPAVDTGFHYDFDLSRPFTDGDLSAIEAEMQRIVESNLNFSAELVDSCARPHVRSTREIAAFKLVPVAGAGGAKRIYGTAFATRKELDEHLHRLEEANRRDFRILGPELGLCSFEDGAILWHPKGARLRHLVEQLWHQEHLAQGYELVGSPRVVGPAPTSCRFHAAVYAHAPRSVRDLPLRLAELHADHDAHVFVSREQLAAEIVRSVELCLQILRAFGLGDFELRVGDAAVRAALEAAGISCAADPGAAASRIELAVRDALGREHLCGTIQIDREGELTHIGSDGQPQRTAVLHRALSGSLDRLVALLVEHHAGAFPLWLAPLQARVITGTDAQRGWAESVRETLVGRGLRVDIDLSSDKLGAKIRRAQLEKIPLMLVCGDKEVAAGAVAPRTREGAQMPAMPLAEFAQWMEHEAQIPRPAARA
jgi:threonyl-tRNA synthetase